MPGRPGEPPRIVGFVAESQRRRIFVNANRIADLGGDGARLRSWDVDLNPFKPMAGQFLIGKDVIDRKVGDQTVCDVGLREVDDRAATTSWEVAKVRLVTRNLLRRRPSYRLVDFDEVPGLFPGEQRGGGRGGPSPRPAPGRGRQHRARAAARPAPPARRGDGRRAPRRRARGAARGGADAPDRRARPRPPRRRARRDGVRRPRRPARRDVRRAARTDPRGDGRRRRRRRAPAAHLRGGHGRRDDDARADPARADGDGRRRPRPDPRPRLGGVDRRPGVRVPAAVQGADRAAPRHRPLPAPAARVAAASSCATASATTRRCGPDATDRAVAELLARYDMLAVAVCDAEGHLLGAVTVDDVLDRQLGTTWRQRHRGAEPVRSKRRGRGTGGADQARAATPW